MSVIEQIRSGARDGLARLYSTYRTEFIGWAVKQFNCPRAAAEDAWQQTIVIFYENVVSGRLQELSSSEKTYLFAIGKNKLREFNRTQMREQELGEFDTAEDAAPEPLDQQMLEKAVACLDALGEPCRSLLVEFYYHRSSMDQIVARLGYRNEDTAKSQKYKCLVRLRKKFFEATTKKTMQ
ncbi:MAG TPA: sigma-70 family RNA polymerase sigma factor [Cyclobacteriaceae bacterium]|nr:sigma-70 family RNA polymerase sigma factor [Cyclobacteriaceae bacterium]